MAASLGIKEFSVQNMDKWYRLRTTVSVSKDGVFATTLPAEEVEKLKEYGVPMATNRLGNLGYFESKSMEDLEVQIKSFLKECFSRELVESKRVIKYKISTYCNYCVNPYDGEIVPGISWLPEDVKEPYRGMEGRLWKEGTTSRVSNQAPAQITFWFRIVEKNTYRYASGKQVVEYTPVRDFSNAKQTAVDWLMSVVGHGPDSWREKWQDGEEVDCTEENAMVFVALYKFICKSNELLSKIAVPEKLAELAQSIPMQLRLGSGKEE